MKFKVGDLVTPSPAFVGHKNVFTVSEENLIDRTFGIRLFADITNAEDNIPHNDIFWREDELELIRTIESLKDASKNCFIEDVMEKTAVYYKENEGKIPSEFLSRNFEKVKITFPAPDKPYIPKEVRVGKNLLEVNTADITRIPYVKDIEIQPIKPFFEHWNWKPRDDGYEIKLEKEENVMYKILDIYEGKERKKINDSYDERIKSIIEDDEIQKIIKEMENQVRTVAGEKANGYSFNYPGLYEDRTRNAIMELENEKTEKIKKLLGKITAIKALLELAPNYEEKLKILRDYEIMDKKKNIIL